MQPAASAARSRALSLGGAGILAGGGTGILACLSARSCAASGGRNAPTRPHITDKNEPVREFTLRPRPPECPEILGPCRAGPAAKLDASRTAFARKCWEIAALRARISGQAQECLCHEPGMPPL